MACKDLMCPVHYPQLDWLAIKPISEMTAAEREAALKIYGRPPYAKLMP